LLTYTNTPDDLMFHSYLNKFTQGGPLYTRLN
jgi:hypothetical protein